MRLLALLLLASVSASAGVIEKPFPPLEAAMLVMIHPTLDAIPPLEAPVVGASIARLTSALAQQSDTLNAAWDPTVQKRILAFANATHTVYPQLRKASAAFVAEAQKQRALREQPALPSLEALAVPQKDGEARTAEFYDRSSPSESRALVAVGGGDPYRTAPVLVEKPYSLLKRPSLRAATRLVKTVDAAGDAEERKVGLALDVLTGALDDHETRTRLLSDTTLFRRVALLSRRFPQSSQPVGEQARAFLAAASEREIPRDELERRRYSFERTAHFAKKNTASLGVFPPAVGFILGLMVSDDGALAGLVTFLISLSIGVIGGGVNGARWLLAARGERHYRRRLETENASSAARKALPPGGR